MDDEHGAVVEVDREVFRPPPDGDDFPPSEALDEAARERNAKVAAPLLDLEERRAFHDRRKAAADGFDFGKFGHR